MIASNFVARAFLSALSANIVQGPTQLPQQFASDIAPPESAITTVYKQELNPLQAIPGGEHLVLAGWKGKAATATAFHSSFGPYRSRGGYVDSQGHSGSQSDIQLTPEQFAQREQLQNLERYIGGQENDTAGVIARVQANNAELGKITANPDYPKDYELRKAYDGYRSSNMRVLERALTSPDTDGEVLRTLLSPEAIAGQYWARTQLSQKSTIAVRQAVAMKVMASLS